MGPSVLMILGFLLSPALSSDMQDGDRIIFESSVTGILGEDVYLRCLYTGNESLLNSFWKRLGGSKKLAGYNGVRSMNREGFSAPASASNLTVKLHVDSLNAEGVYTCEFSTYEDQLESHVSLTVLVRPDVNVETKEETVDGTQYQSVSCTATNAKPAPHISWEINGNAPSADVFSVQTESANHANGTLSLASVLRFPTQLNDESSVDCLVQHPALSEPQRTTAQVQTFVAPKVTMETGLDPGTGGGRALRVVNCTALGGRPQPKIAWILSGGENTLSARERSDDDHTLISSVSFPVGSHEGEDVTCVVTHPKLTSPIEITQTLPTYILSSVQLVYPNGTALDELPLDEGEPGMTLALKVQGDVPSYQTECTKDDSSLPDGVELEGDELTFRGPIAQRYAGQYQCQASFSKHKASTQLDVSVKPGVQAPTPVAPIISVKTWRELDSVTVECSASDAVPAPNVSWSLPPGLTAAEALNTTSLNGSDSATATLTLPPCMPEEYRVQCLVEHQLFKDPERREIELSACAHPNITVQLSVVWRQGSAYSEAECRVESVRPRANISWHLLGDNTKLGHGADGGVELLGSEEQDPSMEEQVVAVSSVLQLPLAEHQGKTVVCVVSHQSLLEPERREIQLQAPDPPEIQALLVSERGYSPLVRAVCAYSSESGGANITWLLPDNNTVASVVSSSAREGSKFKANASYEFRLPLHQGSALTCLIHQKYGNMERRVVTVPWYYISSLSVMNKTTCASGDGVVVYRVALQEHLAHQKILLQVKGNVPYSQIVCSSKDGGAALQVRETSALTSVLEFPMAVSKRDAGQYVCTASFHHLSTNLYILVEVTDNAVQHVALIIICFTTALAITLFLGITLCVFCKRHVPPVEKDRRKKRESLATLTSLMQDPRSPELKKAALPGVKGQQYAELVSIVLVQKTTV
ncbi:uncharacterized protein si:ch211-149e23.4 isoform X2 [Sardina pilchardus]|uniref:uncharacterized protein si:ch211-149e23.4 isoform X2 n=1 Tax=Sardina pilchardus TaxID=27697 RepID=UPI002E0EE1AD